MQWDKQLYSFVLFMGRIYEPHIFVHSEDVIMSNKTKIQNIDETKLVKYNIFNHFWNYCCELSVVYNIF